MVVWLGTAQVGAHSESTVSATAAASPPTADVTVSAAPLGSTPGAARNVCCDRPGACATAGGSVARQAAPPTVSRAGHAAGLPASASENRRVLALACVVVAVKSGSCKSRVFRWAVEAEWASCGGEVFVAWGSPQPAQVSMRYLAVLPWILYMNFFLATMFCMMLQGEARGDLREVAGSVLVYIRTLLHP